MNRIAAFLIVFVFLAAQADAALIRRENPVSDDAYGAGWNGETKKAPSKNAIYDAGFLSGTVGIGNGGTGQTTAGAAFNALSPMTTLGDLIYGAASGAGTRLAGNATTTRKFLRQVGDGANSAAPAWDTVTATDVGLGNVTNNAQVKKAASSTNNAIPQWSGTNGDALQTGGLAVVTSVGSPGADTSIPTEKAVRSAISGAGGGDVSGPASATDGNFTSFDGATGKLIKDSGYKPADFNNGNVMTVVLEGAGGGALTTGTDKAQITIANPIVITGWYITGKTASASIVVDVNTCSSYPTGCSSVAGSELPTLSSAYLANDTNLTTWTATSFAAGTVFSCDIDSVTSETKAIITFKGKKVA